MATGYQRYWTGQQQKRHEAELAYVADPDLEQRLRAYCDEIGMVFPWYGNVGIASDAELMTKVWESSTRHLVDKRYGVGSGASLRTTRARVVGIEVNAALLSRGVTQEPHGYQAPTWERIVGWLVNAAVDDSLRLPHYRAALACTLVPNERSAVELRLMGRIAATANAAVPVTGPTDRAWFERFAVAVMAAVRDPATDWTAVARDELAALRCDLALAS